ncbi:hypothetical protein OEZ86_001860 [Tetradesmus obliquus]|nr:hypothetical protein OEZ86_001860 [Tetradesmus obliquus]
MELPEHLQHAAEAELGETAERRSASLAELKQLVAENSSSAGLAPAGAIKALLAATADTGLTTEEVLLQHLRARKFNVAKAFEALSLRSAFLQEYPDLSKDVAGSEFLQVYGRGLVRVLPGTDAAGRRIISIRPSNMTEVPVDPLLIRWQVFVMSRLARDPAFQVHGVVLVGNFDSVKLTDAKFMAGQLRHGRLRLMMHYIRSCAPARIGGIFIVNQPKFIGIVWGLMSLFMGSKIRKRVRFLGNNLQALHEAIPLANLPPELGGSLQQADPLEWLQQQIEQQAEE